MFMTPDIGKSVMREMTPQKKPKTKQESLTDQHCWVNCTVSWHTEDSDYPELRGYSPYEEEGGPILRPLTSEELSRTEPYTQLDKKVVRVSQDTWTSTRLW